MLGKDYMLAIILVNCDDNLWNDQNLEADLDLPPGWRKIHDSSGTYYWHVPTGMTQWQHPSCTSDQGQSVEAALPETNSQTATMRHVSRERPIPSPMASLPRRSTSLTWHGEEHHQTIKEPGSKCFVVRSLGWVEIPEEDLAPGKSSIAVNNCIQQLSQNKCDNWEPADRWGELQLRYTEGRGDSGAKHGHDPEERHHEPGGPFRPQPHPQPAHHQYPCLGCGLQQWQIMAERTVASNCVSRSVTLEPLTPDALSRQVDILDAVGESVQKFEVLYIGSLPVTKAMGMDVLNNAIEDLMSSQEREQWAPSVISISDSVMQADQTEDLVKKEEEEEDTCIWQCQVRYVTFIGIGKDAHTFALITDMGQQRFQCTAFWCEPDAVIISEAVQAACMVQYQKCLVASTSRMKPKIGSRSILKMKRTVSVDSPVCPFPATGHSLQKNGSGGPARKRGVFSFFEAFRQKYSMLQTP
ncbi:amyloid-beta A4 precursor protein-binding family B member 3 isoform X3 [Sceloporus undulatus]|uniref:amyloid-beta A4 precursor protein-binding family B member 3 isoform X3 n=1 Tax=Sceloporus undulatus TaxID=8520 RepID=UPI001C4B694B|nr:amyloid-beta A4 precursor protein-binding family B member 3 isoform X3 [Sceloporus undulatus]